jgi:hypothetical protein
VVIFNASAISGFFLAIGKIPDSLHFAIAQKQWLNLSSPDKTPQRVGY